MHMKKTAAIALAFAMVGSAALAQNYPNRPITLLVPFAAGGATDTVARVTAQSMSKLLGQPIVIENATGAGGTIAATRASRAEPDGYTLMIHHIGISTAATLYRKLAYDTKTAFAPVGLVTNAPMTIIGRPDLPPNTLAELVTYIKANGDKMTFGNAGLGAASHLCGMLFMTAVGKEILAVPYKGNAPVMNDLIAKGTIDQRGRSLGTADPRGRPVRGLTPLSARCQTARAHYHAQSARRSLAITARATPGTRP